MLVRNSTGRDVLRVIPLLPVVVPIYMWVANLLAQFSRLLGCRTTLEDIISTTAAATKA